MACCGGSGMTAEEEAAAKEERLRSKELEKAMQQQHAQELGVNKLLLLGAGESGKSTLFKQMILIHGKGFKEEAERKSFIPIVHSNILTSMKTLCEQSDKLAAERHLPTTVSAGLQPSKQWFIEAKLEADTAVTPEIAQHVAALWQDPGIQATFEHRELFQLFDSAKYFFNKVIDVAKPTWIPTNDDILRSRVRTTGIVENDFEISGNHFRMFDVGGQRNERKKWIHCFEDVTALLFVASISEYDQVLFEDESTNRLTEALTLWKEIIGLQWFKKTSMILFLNKRDLFAEKIEKSPLERYFPEFEKWKTDLAGGKYASLFDAGLDWMEFKFREPYTDNAKRPLYIHVTCATDTQLMKTIFEAVKDIVIRKSLVEGGLLA